MRGAARWIIASVMSFVRPIAASLFALRCALLIAGAAVAWPISATPSEAQVARSEEDYLRCLDTARRDPEAALSFAETREAEGAGAPARQCAAVALVVLGRYGEAAARFEMLADTVVLEQRPGFMAEGAQAWALAGRPDRAAVLAQRAVHLAPHDVELWVDLALFRAELDDHWGAIDALDRAEDLAPNRSDILIYRASARRLLGAPDLALDDVERALLLSPDDPIGLLERGIIRRLTGNASGAIADWRRVMALTPGSGEAHAAEANITKLESGLN